MKAPLTIVARIEAKPDSIDILKAGLLGLIEPTRAEEGCLQYDLHQDHENPALFLFFENWASRELWQKHMASAHLTAFIENTEGKIESLTVNEMGRVG